MPKVSLNFFCTYSEEAGCPLNKITKQSIYTTSSRPGFRLKLMAMTAKKNYMMTIRLLLGLISPKNTLHDDENNCGSDCVDELNSHFLGELILVIEVDHQSSLMSRLASPPLTFASHTVGCFCHAAPGPRCFTF